MIILGIHTGHDAASALFVEGRLVAYCKEERLTRIKSDGRRLLLGSISEVLEIAGISRDRVDAVCLSRMNLPIKYFRQTAKPVKTFFRRMKGKTMGVSSEQERLAEADVYKVIDEDKVRSDLGLRSDAKVYFANHHYSHVLGAFQFTTWEKDALYLSCDGGGDGAFYSAYGWDGKQLRCLYGGEETVVQNPQNSAASIGLAYSAVTKHLGFRANRHEGKITGLAAFGIPVLAQKFYETFIVNEDGSISSTFPSMADWRAWMKAQARNISREDLAASIQIASEMLVERWVKQMLELFPAKYVGLSGGVFSNVRLNQKVAELPGIEEVYVFPAMGDEGLPVGNCTHVMIETYGLDHLYRYQFDDVYFGRSYSGDELLQAARESGMGVKVVDEPANLAAQLLSHNLIGAVFYQRMEMGPRALGGRSIVAAPVDRGLNDSLNDRLERTEFMPFAPYVLKEDAETVFKISDVNRHACHFMTITTDVNNEFFDSIPAVVHVDGTARPQIICRENNPLYYDILNAYKQITSIPCLVNTSFNAHEEPIINTPSEAVTALSDGRVDFLVCESGLAFAKQGEVAEYIDESGI